MTAGPNQQRRRYARQMRLANVGPSGQAKLCMAKVAIRSEGFVGAIERRYVLAAGMTETETEPTVDPRRLDAAADVETLGLRHAAAREVAEGALRALAAIRLALEDEDGAR